MAADVRIVLTGHGRGEVYLDGEKIDKVRRLKFTAGVGEGPNLLELEICAERVEIIGPAEVAEDAEADQ